MFATISNERDARLKDWLAVYGYLIDQDRRWLSGIVAGDLIAASGAATQKVCGRRLARQKG
jgi:hypothetical protein